MKNGIYGLAIAFLCSCNSFAATAMDPVSGLPIAPGFEKTADPVKTYTFCGKTAHLVVYAGGDSSDPDNEDAWYAHAMPGAVVFTAVGGVVTYFKADGTAAVETAGPLISFLRFSPGLSPAEMKILGAAPAAKSCTAE